MKVFYAVLSAMLVAAANAQELVDYDLSDADSEARLFFVNFTSSLVQVNATILAYGLLFLAILGAAAVALYYLYLESQNSQGYGQSYGYGNNQYNYQYARSNDASADFNPMKIIEWIGVFREMYDNFDYNDLECQKRLICDVMKNSDKLGAGAQKIKSGFRAAKFLEVLALPEDLRELLDEYLDADRMSESQKDCSEYFQCPFSLKDSARTHLTENHLF